MDKGSGEAHDVTNGKTAKGRRMSTALRRSTMGFFAVAAITVTMASVAWACVPNMTNAHVWFCKFNVVTCNELNRVGTSSTNGASTSRSYYSMLGGQDALSTDDVVSANTNYTLRWITGDHAGNYLWHRDCHDVTQSVAFKANGIDASFQTSSTGVWAGKGPVSMPAAGTYTICAAPTAGGFSVGSSSIVYPFVVV